MRCAWSLGVVLAAAAGCGDNTHTGVDGSTADAKVYEDAPPIDGNPLTPATLAETGLCTNAACTTFSADVRAYAPQFALWTDGAVKRRWMYLPPGTTIDTSDMNFWKFPVGTKFWKEFTRDGVRVETRYMVKLLADDAALGAWFFVAYQWNLAQTETTAVTQGVMDANGTQHDIPSRSQCRRCHENNPSRVLGFSAISLDYAAPAGMTDLDDAIGLNLLSAAPTGATSPHFPLPGTAIDQAAFGYLHANCGHCHNPRSTVHATTALELRLDVTKLATTTVTPTYLTTVNVNGTVGGLLGKIIKPQDTANSVIITRTNATTSPPKMPELGTEIVDPAGQAALTAWIGSLPL